MDVWSSSYDHLRSLGRSIVRSDGIIKGVRIPNYRPAQELFRGVEFRIDGARYIHFASVRIPNYFLPELRPNILIVSGSILAMLPSYSKSLLLCGK